MSMEVAVPAIGKRAGVWPYSTVMAPNGREPGRLISLIGKKSAPQMCLQTTTFARSLQTRANVGENGGPRAKKGEKYILFGLHNKEDCN